MKKLTALAALLAVPALAAPAGYFQVPGTDTTLKLYGQIQLREAYGFNGNGLSTDPTARGTGSRDLAQNGNEDTRQKGQWSGDWRAYFGVTTTTPSAFGDIETKIEGRFKNTDKNGGNGQAANFNSERFYIALAGFKIGNDDSIFGYGAWEPNTLFGCYSDENGDWYRVRQLTYMGSPIKGLTLGVSLEGQNDATKPNAEFLDYDEKTNDLTGQGSNGTVPNVSAVAAYTADWGGVTGAINYQQAKTWALNGNERSGDGFSWFVSGGWNITPSDVISAMILSGGGNYGSYHDGFYNDPSDASSFGFYRSLAYNVSYTHTWNDQWSSAFTVGQVKWNKDLNAVVPDDYKLTEFILTTTWQMTKTLSLGAEYQHAQLKADNTSPFYNDSYQPVDTNKLDQLRFKLKATLF